MSLTNNIVGYWDLIANSRDAIGTNHGTDTSVTYNDIFGSDTNIANYNGTSSKTTTSASFATGANAKAFSVWFNSDSASDRGWIVAGGTDVDTQAFGLFVQSDDLFFHGNGGASDILLLDNLVTQDAWVHVVITYDGTNVRFYLNGTLSSTTARTLNTTGTGIWFGGRKNGDADGWFDGGISRVGVWSRNLDQSDVTALYNSGSGLTYRQLSNFTTKYATVNAADVPSTQSNFPVYVDLSRLGITTSAQANSVRVFTDAAKTTEIPREIVSTSEMHAKVTSLTNATTLYVEYDGVRANYAATDTYGRNAVWSDFRASYRLEDTTDSAGTFNLTNGGGSVNFGSMKIGNGADFGTSATGNTLRLYPTADVINNNNAITVSYWYRQNTTLSGANSENGHLTASYVNASGHAFSINSYWDGVSDTYWRIIRRTSSDVTNDEYSHPNDTDWHHVTYTYDTADNKYRFYVDNTLIITSAASTGTFNATTYPRLAIGGSFMCDNGAIDIDQFTVAAATRSANWITTEYNNQSDEPGFWGTWSTVITGSSTSPTGGVAYSNGATMY